jgi:hypothetical protein
MISYLIYGWPDMREIGCGRKRAQGLGEKERVGEIAALGSRRRFRTG